MSSNFGFIKFIMRAETAFAILVSLLVPPKSSAGSTFSAATIFAMSGALTNCVPVSITERCFCVTSSISASCVCVRFRLFLSLRKFSPKSFGMSMSASILKIMTSESEKENILLWNKYTCKYVNFLTFCRISNKMDFIRGYLYLTKMRFF